MARLTARKSPATDALAAFLAARLDEVEAAALAAASDRVKLAGRPNWSVLAGTIVVDAEDPGNWAVADLTGFIEDESIAAHIARHDPGRALREVAAKRGRLERYLAQPGYDLPPGVAEGRDPDERMRDQAVKDALEDEVREDAAVYSDHPEYREEWKP